MCILKLTINTLDDKLAERYDSVVAEVYSADL